jgi:hypothetical protein
MSPLSNLERLVDETFHSVILEFDPRNPSSYRKCVETLEKLDERIESSTEEIDTKRSFLVRVRSHLALMASEASNHVDAERLTANVLKLASLDDPDFALAVSIRTKTLHSLGRHDQEITEGLLYAESEGVAGQALVHLLAQLARRHPECMERIGSIMPRVEAYVSNSPELSERIGQLSLSEEDPGSYILGVAALIREISLEMMARALQEPSME